MQDTNGSNGQTMGVINFLYSGLYVFSEQRDQGLRQRVAED